jgi:DNA invertase Pin-like site-specific DNA recombinase
MKSFCAYIRVSTARQGEHGVSLQEQREAIERYARQHNLHIAEWFEEQQTAAKRGRPAFSRLMRRLADGTRAGVVIHKIDRSARNLRDWADLGELVDRGLEVHIAHDTLDLRSRGGRLSADIQAVVAADYVRNLREETIKGMYGRLKQGLFPRPAPLGYRDEGSGKPKSIDPVMGPLIKEAFARYATGRFSLQVLQGDLYRLGLRSRYGSQVRIAKLAEILHNPFYMGIIRVVKNNQRFLGVHQPLISASLFDAVQDVFQWKAPKRTAVRDLLFRRLLTCELCGTTLIGEMQKGRAYYRCHTKGCLTTTVRGDVVDEHMVELLSRVTFSEDDRRLFEEELTALMQDRVGSEQNRAQSRALRLIQLNTRLTRLTDAYLENALDTVEFQRRKAALDLERRQLDEPSGTDPDEFTPAEVRFYIELAQRPSSLYKVALPDEKRDLVRIVTSNRGVRGRTPRFQLAIPFSDLANSVENQSGDPPCSAPRTRESIRALLKKWMGELRKDDAQTVDRLNRVLRSGPGRVLHLSSEGEPPGDQFATGAPLFERHNLLSI